jgi:hypothetical protein
MAQREVILMTKFQEIAQELLDNLISFSVHTPGKDSDLWVITVTDSLTNDQLKVLVKHGGLLEPNGIVRLLHSEG